MLDRLETLLGRRVVADYKTNNGTVFYAKGRLVEVNSKYQKLLIENEEKEIQWYLDWSSIVNLKVKEGDE